MRNFLSFWAISAPFFFNFRKKDSAQEVSSVPLFGASIKAHSLTRCLALWLSFRLSLPIILSFEWRMLSLKQLNLSLESSEFPKIPVTISFSLFPYFFLFFLLSLPIPLSLFFSQIKSILKCFSIIICSAEASVIADGCQSARPSSAVN